MTDARTEDRPRWPAIRRARHRIIAPSPASEQEQRAEPQTRPAPQFPARRSLPQTRQPRNVGTPRPEPTQNEGKPATPDSPPFPCIQAPARGVPIVCGVQLGAVAWLVAADSGRRSRGVSQRAKTQATFTLLRVLHAVHAFYFMMGTHANVTHRHAKAMQNEGKPAMPASPPVPCIQAPVRRRAHRFDVVSAHRAPTAGHGVGLAVGQSRVTKSLDS